MKKLYIIRHAKSSWKDMSLTDYDRPLNKRGKHNSKFMGELLQKNGVKADIIISSPAKRASDTAINIAKEIDYPTENIIYDESIYEASSSTLLHIIQAIDDKYQKVFLIGHNPSLNTLLDHLIPNNDIYNIVTAGIVELELDIDSWKHLSAKNCRFLSFEYPKKYTI
jgi:phosphohistidine phosphatase